MCLCRLRSGVLDRRFFRGRLSRRRRRRDRSDEDELTELDELDDELRRRPITTPLSCLNQSIKYLTLIKMYIKESYRMLDFVAES